MDFQARYAFLTQLIWTIDQYLFILTIALCIFIIFYSLIKKSYLKRKEKELSRIKKKIQVLALGGKDILQKTSPIILSGASTNQLLNIVKEDGKVIPEQFRREFQEAIIKPSQLARVKRTAQRSMNLWKRIEAIYTLSLVSPNAALEILEKNIKNKNADIRYFSLLALGGIKNIESAKILLENLKNPFFSSHKIISLLENFPEDITAEILKKIDDSDPDIRSWCIRLLSRFTKKQYFEKIKELTCDLSPQVRASAAACLGEYGNPAAKDPLLNCLNDQMWIVKMHAAKALNQIFGKQYLPEISKLLETKEWFLRETAKSILLEHFNDALPRIEQFMQLEDETIRRDCVEIMENANYIISIFKDLLYNQSASIVSKLRLLKAIIKTQAHLGIENALNSFGKIESEKILQVVGAFDPELKNQIENKLKNLIAEI